MFEKLRQYFFVKYATKFIKANVRDSRFVNYENAKTILVLFESDYSEKNILIRRIIQNLIKDGKKVCAWGYIEKKEITTAILPDFRILHHKDTDIYKKPKVSYLNELDDMEFDLLIDLSVNEILTLQYIALHANAFCKTGVVKNKLKIFDFGLNLDNVNGNDENEMVDINPRYILDHIIFYLKSIQTKD